jgi:hypothetical protein
MDKLLEISELILSEHNTGISFKNLEKPLILIMKMKHIMPNLFFKKMQKEEKLVAIKLH